jgi:hypothetical protein
MAATTVKECLPQGLPLGGMVRKDPAAMQSGDADIYSVQPGTALSILKTAYLGKCISTTNRGICWRMHHTI